MHGQQVETPLFYQVFNEKNNIQTYDHVDTEEQIKVDQRNSGDAISGELNTINKITNIFIC
jgi:hypothetical protein